MIHLKSIAKLALLVIYPLIINWVSSKIDQNGTEQMYYNRYVGFHIDEDGRLPEAVPIDGGLMNWQSDSGVVDLIYDPRINNEGNNNGGSFLPSNELDWILVTMFMAIPITIFLVGGATPSSIRRTSNKKKKQRKDNKIEWDELSTQLQKKIITIENLENRIDLAIEKSKLRTELRQSITLAISNYQFLTDRLLKLIKEIELQTISMKQVAEKVFDNSVISLAQDFNNLQLDNELNLVKIQELQNLIDVLQNDVLGNGNSSSGDEGVSDLSELAIPEPRLKSSQELKSTLNW